MHEYCIQGDPAVIVLPWGEKESWGLGEKSSLLEGMQELLCESRVLQEAWGPCRSFGCRPRPEDDTSLLRRETSI